MHSRLLLLLICLSVACTDARQPFVAPEDAGQVVDAGRPDRPDASVTCETDLTSDPRNCGRCGRACAATELCVAGECRPSTNCATTGCPWTRAYCDETTGVCRTGCAADGDCGAGRLCNREDHQCEPAPANCTTEPCPRGHRCDSGSALCVAGCGGDADCFTGSTCVAGSCVITEVPCLNGSCPAGQWCDSGLCREGCSQGSPCADSAACDLSTHQCGVRPTRTSCVIEGCRSGLWCNSENGQCSTGCAGTAGCPSGQYCDLSTHSCQLPPTTCAGGCPAGSRCVGGACAAGCDAASDCGSGALCDTDTHACQPAPPDCSVNGCPGGQYCDPRTLQCKAGCANAAGCPMGQTCDVATARCLVPPTNCVRNPRCGVGTRCDSGDGLCKQTCTSPSDCPDGICDIASHYCAFSCSRATCPAGSYCDGEGRCVEGCSIPNHPCPAGQLCNELLHECVASPDEGCPQSCPSGTYCDRDTARLCLPGCDRNHPCAEGQWCSFETHACYEPCTGCYDNCTARGGDWCEENQCIDLRANVSHCGGCGAVCSSNHVTAACAEGQCSGACESGYGDCNDDKQRDGCETNLTSDLAHCGECGRTCARMLAYATGTCRAGACAIESCQSEHYDCDHKPENGCESTSYCWDGTYEACPNSTCDRGNRCIHYNSAATRICLHPCSVDADCPMPQRCAIPLAAGGKLCGLPCSYGCPSLSTCVAGICDMPR